MLVLSVSSPRAGSSWYFHMTNALIAAGGGQDIDALRQRFGRFFPEATENANVGILYGTKLLHLALISQIAGTYAVKTHAKPTRGLRILTNYNMAKTTFIFRDPRDRLVSIMNAAKKAHERGNTDRNFGRISGFDDALDDISTSYQHYLMWENHPETLMMPYEDLVLNPIDQMQRTRDFLRLNVDNDTVADIVAQYDKNRGDANRTHFVRGQIGSYKDSLTSEQIQRIHERIGDDLVKMGYAID